MDTSDNELWGQVNSRISTWDVAKPSSRVLQNNYSAEYGCAAQARSSNSSKQVRHKRATRKCSLNLSTKQRSRQRATFQLPAGAPLQTERIRRTIGGPAGYGFHTCTTARTRRFSSSSMLDFDRFSVQPILLSVPTAAERNGIVNIAGSNGQPDQLNVPAEPECEADSGMRYPITEYEPNGPLGAEHFSRFRNQHPTGTTNPMVSSRRPADSARRIRYFFGLPQSTIIRSPLQDPSLAILQRSFSSSARETDGKYATSADLKRISSLPHVTEQL